MWLDPQERYRGYFSWYLQRTMPRAGVGQPER
jgi:hypothetical protein